MLHDELLFSVTLIFNGPKALAVKKEKSQHDGVNDGLRIEIIRIAELIRIKEGLNALDIATRRGKSKPTIERHLRIAKKAGIIEFKGAPKTGGYYLTEKTRGLISK